MALPQDAQRQLNRFRRQYLQLLQLHAMEYPSADLLREAEVQQWIFTHLFNHDVVELLPPARYQVRVLKELVTRIENAITDPNEDEISDELMSALSSLLSSNLPSETDTAQQKAFVSYAYDAAAVDEEPSNERTVTLLESRYVISSSGSTGLRTWEAALHLAAFITGESSSVHIHGKSVIELGAGLGFLSILCAKHLGAKKVLATDGDEAVVDLLKSNIFLNGLEGDGRIEASVLRWGRTFSGAALEEDFEERPYDLVLAADVTYDSLAIPALVATLRDLFERRSDLEVIVSATVRNETTFRKFTAVSEANGFVMTEIPFTRPSIRWQTDFFCPTSTPIKIVRITRKG